MTSMHTMRRTMYEASNMQTHSIAKGSQSRPMHGFVDRSPLGDLRDPTFLEEDQHEWELHSNATDGSRRQCQLCAVQLCQLYTLQAPAGMTVLSTSYARRLVAHIRCSRCMVTSSRDADELLRDDAIICRLCMSRGSLSSSTISSAASTASTLSHRDDSINMMDLSSSNSHLSPQSSSEDEDVSIVTLLHRQVVKDATRLKHSMREGGSKAMPIVVDDTSAPFHSQSQRASLPYHGGSSPMAIDLTHSSHSSSSFSSPPSPPTLSAANSVSSTVSSVHTVASHGSHSGSSPPHLSSTSTAAAAAAPVKKRVGPNLKAARMKRLSSEDSTDCQPDADRPSKKARMENGVPMTTATGSTSASCNHSSANGTGCTAAPKSRTHIPYHMTSASGNTFAPSDPIDIYSSFVQKDISDAARRQQALFEQARRRLETRRQLNIEPISAPQTGGAYLPYHRGAKHVKDGSMAAAASGCYSQPLQPPPPPFILPRWFRSEGAIPYTIEERKSACSELISAAGVVHKCLCLPNMQPQSWPGILHATSPSPNSAQASPTNVLSHHYRRLAKLVHPDKCPVEVRTQAESAFKILHQAYTQLTTLV